MPNQREQLTELIVDRWDFAEAGEVAQSILAAGYRHIDPDDPAEIERLGKVLMYLDPNEQREWSELPNVLRGFYMSRARAVLAAIVEGPVA